MTFCFGFLFSIFSNKNAVANSWVTFAASKLCFARHVHSLYNHSTWWHHQMEALSALLAFVRVIHRSLMNSPNKRPVTRSFDVFFDLCLHVLLCKLLTLSCMVINHRYDVTVSNDITPPQFIPYDTLNTLCLLSKYLKIKMINSGPFYFHAQWLRNGDSLTERREYIIWRIANIS